MKYSYAYSHSPINFYFKQSPRDFVVDEIPLYNFSGDGEHLILKVRKKNITTFDLLKVLSSTFGIKEKEIGYAGLKDRNALTIQYFSLPKRQVNLEILENFSHENIKILDKTFHCNKIKLGHLKGNNFFIRLKKVDNLNYEKISQVIEKIRIYGIPNYFGYQRFGKNLDNYKEGEKITKGTLKIRSKKMGDFLVSAYQSYLFNAWLSLRIDISHIFAHIDCDKIYDALKFLLKDKEIPILFKNKEFCNSIKKQKHFFKVFCEDCFCHYPFGKNFITKEDDLLENSKRFFDKDISVMGLLYGKKMNVTLGIAGFFENLFLDFNIKSVGQRRYAWIFPQDMRLCYKEEEAQVELHFFLPKGAYATNLLREIAHSEIIQRGENEF